MCTIVHIQIFFQLHTTFSSLQNIWKSVNLSQNGRLHASIITKIFRVSFKQTGLPNHKVQNGINHFLIINSSILDRRSIHRFSSFHKRSNIGLVVWYFNLPFNSVLSNSVSRYFPWRTIRYSSIISFKVSDKFLHLMLINLSDCVLGLCFMIRLMLLGLVIYFVGGLIFEFLFLFINIVDYCLWLFHVHINLNLITFTLILLGLSLAINIIQCD